MGLFDVFNSKEKKQEEKVNTIYIQTEGSGSSGTEVYAGYLGEEYLQSLQSKGRADIYDQMRRSDTQVKMLLSSVKKPIKAASREISAASDEAEHEKHAALCRQVLFKDIKTDKFLNESLNIVEFGNSVFERVHKSFVDKEIKDDDGNPVLSSYIGYKKLGWRSPKTIETWNFNEEKELESIRQFADGDLAVDVNIPVKFLTIMVLDMEGDNYEGMSMLRPCYGSWFRKNDYLKKNAAGIERSMPLPTAEVPAGQENSEQFRLLKTALTRFTSYQQNYLTYPSGWNVNLSNGTNYDPSKVEISIDNEDKRMAKAFLANFLELGGGGGSYALSNDLSDFFLSSLLDIAGVIEESIDEILKELVILNFGKQDKYPTFKFTGIKDKAGEELAKILDLLTKNKIIIPDDKLEKSVRSRYGLPESSGEGQRIIENKPPEMPTLSEKIQFALAERKSK